MNARPPENLREWFLFLAFWALFLAAVQLIGYLRGQGVNLRPPLILWSALLAWFLVWLIIHFWKKHRS